MIRKSDIILLAGIIATGGVIFAVGSAHQEPGAVVKVASGRETYGIYDLSVDREVRVIVGADLNVIHISGGTAEMKEASCPGGDCLRQRPVGRTGQSIVCLPNKVLVSIEGEGDNGIDSITH